MGSSRLPDLPHVLKLWQVSYRDSCHSLIARFTEAAAAVAVAAVVVAVAAARDTLNPHPGGGYFFPLSSTRLKACTRVGSKCVPAQASSSARAASSGIPFL